MRHMETMQNVGSFYSTLPLCSSEYKFQADLSDVVVVSSFMRRKMINNNYLNNAARAKIYCLSGEKIKSEKQD